MMEKEQENEEIPPLSPLIKGGATSGGISSPNGGAEGGGILPHKSDNGSGILPLEQKAGIRKPVYFDKNSVQKRGLTWNGSHLPYNSNNVDYARVMRREMTPAEKKLWYGYLRTFKYRVLRQRPIDHYIADFYCAKLKLVIELDGKHHLNTIEYDKERTSILQIYGLRILRFTNEQVLTDFTNVCKIIEEIPPLSPLIKGGASSGGIIPRDVGEIRGLQEI
ncbi:MAG TPA: DUF559 domain-containing protein [Chitinispirillaceae bacterium]|nr:DUF559 domain-containing protein [Chitinispirillaceae bacterium]